MTVEKKREKEIKRKFLSRRVSIYSGFPVQQGRKIMLIIGPKMYVEYVIFPIQSFKLPLDYALPLSNF